MSAWPIPELESEPTAIDKLLAEQRLLTPVARFAREHDLDPLPSKARYYRDLIPLSLPQAGEQYGFEVDLDKCSGCKACVTACHNLNGLDDEETWRSVGFLYGGTVLKPFQQTVTTACHHCLDPECLNGCPVLAYDKDPITGIVRHLDDQCIGCQYCILKCPYEVPKYNASKGIVRKCDMCSNRLADGEAPACVQACPPQAIRIRIVNQAEVAAKITETTTLVAGAPESHYTQPTTRYLTQREVPANTCAADNTSPHLETPHWPLVFMLLFTQTAVGVFCADFFFGGKLAPAMFDRVHPLQAGVAIALGFVGLGTSVLHLGRPMQAWRSFLGLRRSWLSREIVVFGLFGGLMGVKALSLAAGNGFLPLPEALHKLLCTPEKIALLNGSLVLSGLAGVFCSAMIYADTPRLLWRTPRTGIKFLSSALMLGLAVSLCCANSWRGSLADLSTFNAVLSAALILVAAGKLSCESSALKAFVDVETSPYYRVYLLLSGPLAAKLRTRFAFGIIGGLLLPGLVLFQSFGGAGHSNGAAQPLFAGLIFASCLAGEVLERNLFFITSSGPKMPGGVGL